MFKELLSKESNFYEIYNKNSEITNLKFVITCYQTNIQSM